MYLISLAGSIVALVGWFAFRSIPLLVIGTLAYATEMIYEWKGLQESAKALDFLVFAIGGILYLEKSFLIGGMVAINIYSLILSILTLPVYISKMKKRGENDGTDQS